MFDFDDDVLDQLVDYSSQPPVLICWYSGGFSHEDGVKLLSDLTTTAKAHGIIHQKVMGFPDHYGITGEGYEWWPKYVDRMVEDIDSDGELRDKPLLLFGHSRGACPAMSLATRLGRRVHKVYIAACGPIVLGEPTAWEVMSKNKFKKGGDKELLMWFSELQPGNLLLKRASEGTPEEVAQSLRESKWLEKTTKLMRVQYRDATFPEMTGDNPAIQKILAPIMCISPIYDPGAQPEEMAKYEGSTSGGCEVVKVQGGHMDCLAGRDTGGLLKKSELFDAVLPDMASFLPKRR